MSSMEVRINKYLSEAGLCSRREADKLIEAGKILIDGKPALMGSKVSVGQDVTYRGRKVLKEQEMILIAFNKPVGIVCTTTDKQGTNNIVDYIGYNKRIYPIGRLDKDSEGLILMTNNGEIMDKILRSANGHEKEYVVEVNRPIDDTFIEQMRNGIYLEELERTTNKCFVQKEGDNRFRIILTQGMNRQIRRMCDNLGFIVTNLKRVRIMNITLGELEVGQYRDISEEEYKKLTTMLTN